MTHPMTHPLGLQASAAAILRGCLTIEAGRTALSRIVHESPAVRGLLEVMAEKEASANDVDGHVTAIVRALVSGLGTLLLV